jgi:cytochrome P450
MTNSVLDTPAQAAATGCPFTGRGAGYQAFEHEGMHEFLAQMRQEEPVFYSPEIDYWVVTRRDDVLSVFKNPAVFSASTALESVDPYPPELTRYLADHGFTVKPVQSNCDRPDHTRIRMAAGQFLNAKRYATYEAQIREILDGYIDAMKGKDTVDLVQALTYDFPARIVFLLLGFKDMEPAQIKRWALNRVMMTWGRLSPAELMNAGVELNNFFQFCRQVVQDRKRQPGDDYPSKLLEIRHNDDAVLTENEVCCLVFGLLLAGHEATSNSLSNMVLTLLRTPGAWDKLVANPALIPNAVEESLRHSSSVISWRRRALQDVEIGGVKVPKGAKVMLSLVSANRDECKFADPETFDVERSNTSEHIGFGHGIHVCMGAPLARFQMVAVLEELVKHFPRMRLVEGQKIDWIKTISFRGPTALQIQLEGA